jgi:methionyl-tRNA formyltransferase
VPASGSDQGLRVVFFGTPHFAVPTLDRLLASSHPVVAVITQPDRPRGRGQRVSSSAVKAWALAHRVPVLQPAALQRSQLQDDLTAIGWDLGVVAAYGRMLPDWLLAQPRLGLINVHASLLPRYRGASPVHRAVINGDAETGVTIMRVVKALDAGAMLASVRLPIGLDETSEELERRLAVAGAGLLVETVDRLAAGRVTEEPQDDRLATYAPRLTKADGLIDWQRSARAIHNLVRGLHPWPHAYTFGPGGRLIVHRSAVGASGPVDRPPGTVLAASATEGLAVAAADGALRLLEVQAEGGRVLPAGAFLAGHPLEAGQRLGVV